MRRGTKHGITPKAWAICVLAVGCAGTLLWGCVGGSASTVKTAGGPPSVGKTSPGIAVSPMPVASPSGKRLTAFSSEAELVSFLRELARAQKHQRERAAQKSGALNDSAELQATPATQAMAAGAKMDESVTNVQHAGVDEGGIVKVHGDHLVVLRRGRLFTVKIGDDSLTPVSAVDAFGPDINPGGTWYDEMLVSEGMIVVVGYSYQRGGTELGLFDLDRQGGIRYRATYHLRSNDYYSSRNYASRLLGQKLVFYTPLYMSPDEESPLRFFPALRKWHSGATESEFRPIYTARRVYRPLVEAPTLALHTVTTCDLAQPNLACTATAVMGPPGRVFYVSPTSVYVWMTDWQRTLGGSSRSLLYRLPLEGGEPQVVRVSGSPIDQFSFLEEDDSLNVLLRADAAGDGMWAAEVTQGQVALLRLPLGSFGAEVAEARASRYRALPKPEGHVFQNRFVGDYVLYGSGSGWGFSQAKTNDHLFAYRYAGGGEPTTLRLGHGVDRIEALGGDAIVVGTDGRDLHFSPIRLGDHPFVADRYTRPGAAQGELRSHGFFYKAESDESGILGLPVRGSGRPGYEHLFRDSASILFVRNDGLRLSELGELAPRTQGVTNDGCRASCVDWYGNARPLFLRGRIFALLGYEIVEGQIWRGRLEERQRVSFAPGRVAVSRSTWVQ